MRKSLPLVLAGLTTVLVTQYLPQPDPAPDAGNTPAPQTQVLPTKPPPVLHGPAELPIEVPPRHADFGGELPSSDARQLADWVLDSGNHEGRPFAIVDKVEARVFVFDADGRLQGAAPALLGLAPGDDSVPGIGERPVPDIRPHERTTPAGRFVAERGHNAQGEDIVWVDYDVAISMHRVRPIDPRERRLERLASPTPSDNRISYGCINLPVEFYEGVIDPLIGASRGIVYVLPETLPLQAVFTGYEPREAQQHAALAETEEEAAFWRRVMAR